MIEFVASVDASPRLRVAIAAVLRENGEIGETAWQGRAHLAWAGGTVEISADRAAVLEGVCLRGGRLLRSPAFDDDLDGQFAAIEAVPDSVRVATDTLGMMPLYWTRIGAATLLANRVEPLAQLRGGSLDLDAAAAVVTVGWVTGERTLVEGVSKVPGGARWTLGGDHRQVPGGLRPRGRRWGRGDLAGALQANVEAVAAASDLVEAPLTAGLDSRLIAALLRAGGVNVRYYTEGNDGDVDVTAARELAARLQVEHVVHARPHDAVVSRWQELSRRLVAENDGMVSLWQLSNMLRQPSGVLTLSGIGGEIARGFYTHPDDVLRRRGMVDRFVNRRASGALATKSAADRSRRDLWAFAAAVVAEGFSELDVPDVFYARERVGRWAAAQSRKAGVAMFCPFVTRPWFEAAFALSPARRWSEPLHHSLLGLLAPDLRAFPVEKGWRSQRTTVNVARAALKRIRRRSAVATVPAQRSKPAGLVPLVRQRCLDDASSPLWEVVDRAKFAESTSAQQVLNVGALFEYAELRRSSTAGGAPPTSEPFAL